MLELLTTLPARLAAWLSSGPGNLLTLFFWFLCIAAWTLLTLLFRRQKISLPAAKNAFALTITAVPLIGFLAASAALYATLRPAAVDFKLGSPETFTQNLSYILPPILLSLPLTAAGFLTLHILQKFPAKRIPPPPENENSPPCNKG